MPDNINPVYRKRIEDLKIEGEDYANSAMKSVYLEQKSALDEMHKLIGKIYVDHSKDGFLYLTQAEKNKITSGVKKHLKDMGIVLGHSEISTVTSILGEVFKTTYYKNAFILEGGLKGSVKFTILRPELINAAVSQVYMGEMFSDRIWKNKALMIDKLQSSIVDAMRGTVTIDKVGRNIRDTFNTTAYESKRLVTTETARIQSQASKQIGLDSGCSQVMWSATLDSKTAEKDASYDGKVWEMNNEHPIPPLHPLCRCVLINVPYAEWSPTQRKDNITKEIIDYTDYQSWAKATGITT